MFTIIENGKTIYVCDTVEGNLQIQMKLTTVNPKILGLL